MFVVSSKKETVDQTLSLAKQLRGFPIIWVAQKSSQAPKGEWLTTSIPTEDFKDVLCAALSFAERVIYLENVEILDMYKFKMLWNEPPQSSNTDMTISIWSHASLPFLRGGKFPTLNTLDKRYSDSYSRKPD